MAKELDEAAGALAEFEKSKSIEDLWKASASLEGFNLSMIKDGAERAAARPRAAALWLALLGTIERNIDPNFDPEDVPLRRISPPPSGDEQLPPGVDPKAIADPVARAQYEAALLKNQQKAARHRLQTHLRRLEPRAIFQTEAFFKLHYTSAPADLSEAARVLDEASVSEPRDQRLRKLLGLPPATREERAGNARSGTAQ